MQMHLRTLPHDTIPIHKFWDLMRPEEKFGIGSFRKDELSFRKADIIGLAKDYFTNIVNKTLSVDSAINTENGRLEYAESFEPYPKAVWLTNDFIDNGYQFRDHIGIHWEVETSNWVIHPGGTRQLVLLHFLPPDGIISGLVFNTLGIKKCLDKEFTTFDEFCKYAGKDKTRGLGLVPHQGTFIPHYCQNTDQLHPSVLRTHQHIQNWYNETKIISNSKEITGIFKNSGEFAKKEIYIEIKDNNIQRRLQNGNGNIIRALLVAPFYETFNRHGVVIRPSSFTDKINSSII